MPHEKSSGITAPKLRIALFATIIILAAICGGGFFYFKSQLVNYAIQVQSDAAAAKSSQADIAKLQTLKQQLDSNQVAVKRAQSIVAASQYYQYQNQIIDDITTYAKSAKLGLSGFTFEAASATGSSAAAVTSTAPIPVGLKSTTVTVTIASPADYKSVMSFIHSIELNLTHMQLTGVSLQAIPGDKTNVTVNPLTIEVYTK